MSPRTGRPLSENPKTESFRVRVTPDEKKEIIEFKDKHGLTLLELIRIGMETVKKK